MSVAADQVLGLQVEELDSAGDAEGQHDEDEEQDLDELLGVH